MLSVGAKLTLVPAFVMVDRERLATTMTKRLETAGFAVTRNEALSPYRLRAKRGACQLAVQQVSVEAGENSGFIHRTRAIGPTRFYYGGKISRDFPRFTPVLADQFQRQAARAGLIFAIDPVIAMAVGKDCPDLAPLLAKLDLHNKLGPSALRH